MRILLSGVAIEGGGAEQVMQDLARGFAARGHDVVVAFLEGTDSIVPQLESKGIDCRRLLARRELAEHWWSDITPRCIIQFRDLLREVRPDIVHTHVPRPSMWLALGKRLARTAIPMIYTEHSVQSVYSARGVIAHRVFLPVTEHVTCVSETVRDSFIGTWRWPDHAVTVIYNGIESTRVHQTKPAHVVKSELGIGADESLVCNIANVRDSKGHDVLAHAVRILVEENSRPALCVVAGGLTHEPRTVKALREQIRRLHLEDRLILLGRRDDVPDLLAACDVFCLSSRHEGLPITVLEAMAAGKPVVVTDVGGCAEVVVDGHTGIVVPSENPGALAKAIGTLLANPERAHEMGRAGWTRVNEYFSVQTMVDKHLALYGRVIDGRE